MCEQFNEDEAWRAGTERDVNGMIAALLLLAFVTCLAVVVLAPVVWVQVVAWCTALAMRLVLGLLPMPCKLSARRSTRMPVSTTVRGTHRGTNPLHPRSLRSTR